MRREGEKIKKEHPRGSGAPFVGRMVGRGDLPTHTLDISHYSAE